MLRPCGEDMLAPLRRRVEPVSVAVANEAVELVIAVVHARARREAVTSLAELVPRAGELAEAVLALAVVVRAVSLGLPLRGGARRVGRAHAIVGVTRSNRLVVRAVHLRSASVARPVSSHSASEHFVLSMHSRS